MNNLETAIQNYEKAGEELANAAAIAVLHTSYSTTVEECRETMDRINLAERMGSRAEMRILEGLAICKAKEIVKRKFAEQDKKLT